MVTLGTTSDQQVAVLIDVENVGLGSIPWLFDQISDIGRITVKRAYADWSAAKGRERDQLLDLGIEPVHLFHSGSGKNSSDIRLVMDAIDLLYLYPVDTFVIVSADADFVPLVSRLRAAGKAVIGAGRKATAARTLVRSCDRYLFLDRKDDSKVSNQSSQVPSGDELLVRAIKAARDEQGRVVGAKLYQTLQRLDPSFDFRAMGYTTFTRYLEAAHDINVVRQGRGDLIVELAESNVRDVNSVSDTQTWGYKLDEEWSKRALNRGQTIGGHAAASIAARILGVRRLGDSPYRTLQRLLDASENLGLKWSRDGSTIIRR